MLEFLWRIYAYIRVNFWLLFRYGVSGVSGIVANLIVFAILVEHYDVWYLTAAVFGFLAAYVVTFTMHKFWTFNATPLKRTWSQSLIYFCLLYTSDAADD